MPVTSNVLWSGNIGWLGWVAPTPTGDVTGNSLVADYLHNTRAAAPMITRVVGHNLIFSRKKVITSHFVICAPGSSNPIGIIIGRFLAEGHDRQSGN
jgi:hypothetical protein